MTHYYETKIGKIITEEADARMDGVILTYIIDKGWENVKEITDEQINELEGNGLMTKEFAQSIVKCARKITKECTMYDDFLPYVRKYIGINGCQTSDLKLYKEDYTRESWSEVLDDLNLYEDDKSIESIDLVCVVDGVNYKA